MDAFLTHNDTLMRDNAVELRQGPCDGCAVIDASMGWLYYALVRSAPGETWPERVQPTVPREAWKFDWLPAFPDGIPLLFTYGTCDDGTGTAAPGAPACAPRVGYLDYYGSFIKWVQKREGSQAVAISGGDHWHMCWKSAATNRVIEEWLENSRRDALSSLFSIPSGNAWWIVLACFCCVFGAALLVLRGLCCFVWPRERPLSPCGGNDEDTEDGYRQIESDS